MTCGLLPYVNTIIQFLLLVGLVLYAYETWKIRKISQEQVETLQKPCLTLSATTRPFEDAVLEMHGSNSAQVLHCPEGVLHLINVGLGPAFNVNYTLTPKNPKSSIARPTGYLIHILLRESAIVPVPRGLIQGAEWMFVVRYDSLTGRRYETAITIDDLILTKVTHQVW